ncbi:MULTISPECIES: DUF116 domain-containing protein [unclassified Methanoregula]|uniref:DUF116 domain-containing protein n=1 Tax=unclassified Methanoregula TaxID=2649730 RepID=UPI0009CD7FBD|nr:MULTISPECIES: DUF116 domain-containing protein [unclassified Methanoregula]OPX65553.1 MAG: hypothetical protein A4E33_00095 [Methanoregula sp. PtaB.Bin085]OPY35832.1 MAG: hypothetical protein A4E34_00509 [Methanoregula sp. PtaU1.Bin006]
MALDFLTLNHLIFIVGEITIVVILGSLITAFILVVISLYSIKMKKLYFPQLIKSGLVFLEGIMKAMFRFFGLEDRDLYTFLIKLMNSMNAAEFARIPVTDRAIFMPQCLRSSKCPAHLTPEGLKCRNCGQCEVGGAHLLLEKMGYRVFIVPGSSFIKRMVKKYRPKAIVGVGCLSEVKEGIDMADKMGLVVMGVVTLKEGCVETINNWPELYEIAILGIDPASVPEDLHTLAD